MVAPVIDSGGQVFNVAAFGARGNGTTDDTTAIQDAIIRNSVVMLVMRNFQKKAADPKPVNGRNKYGAAGVAS